MEQPISSLNLPKHLLQQIQNTGCNYVCDIPQFVELSKMPDLQTSLKVPHTKTAFDIFEEECLLGGIPTFIKELDAALDGGILVGLVTEFAGEPDTHKTELCYHICINVQLPEWCGGVQGEAVFIGTNCNFASHRLKEIAQICVEKYNVIKKLHGYKPISEMFTVDYILNKIMYISASSFVELIAAVKYLEKWLKEHQSTKVVIVDSISAPFKQTEIKDRKYLYNIISDLQILARQYKFAVVLTNDMTTRMSSEGAYLAPALGDTYFHRLNTRIQLSRKNSDTLKAVIVKSVNCERKEIDFSLFVPCNIA